jgi:NADPH:quinone reductase-like Zn-dependent oxidoreductase
MLHRCAHIKSGERILARSAVGGVGTALLQLGKLVGLEMYGTSSLNKEKVIAEPGGKPTELSTTLVFLQYAC